MSGAVAPEEGGQPQLPDGRASRASWAGLSGVVRFLRHSCWQVLARHKPRNY